MNSLKNVFDILHSKLLIRNEYCVNKANNKFAGYVAYGRIFSPFSMIVVLHWKPEVSHYHVVP